MKRNLIIGIVAIVLAVGSFVATNNAAALTVALIAAIAPAASTAFGRATRSCSSSFNTPAPQVSRLNWASPSRARRFRATAFA